MGVFGVRGKPGDRIGFWNGWEVVVWWCGGSGGGGGEALGAV